MHVHRGLYLGGRVDAADSASCALAALPRPDLVLCFNAGLAYYPEWEAALRGLLALDVADSGHDEDETRVSEQANSSGKQRVAAAVPKHCWLAVTDYAAYHCDRAERVAERNGWEVQARTTINPFRSPCRRTATGAVRLPNSTNGFLFLCVPRHPPQGCNTSARASASGRMVRAALPIRAGCLEVGAVGLVLEDAGPDDSQPLLVLGPMDTTVARKAAEGSPLPPFWYRTSELEIADGGLAGRKETKGADLGQPMSIRRDGSVAVAAELSALLPASMLAGLGAQAQEEALIAATFVDSDIDHIVAAATCLLPDVITPTAAAGFRGCAAFHLTRLFTATKMESLQRGTASEVAMRARRCGLLVLLCAADPSNRIVAAKLLGVVQPLIQAATRTGTTWRSVK